METMVRGYLLNQIDYKNKYFTVYNAEHSILKGQKLRITLINKEFAIMPKIRSAFNQNTFRLSFAEHKNLIKIIDIVEENDSLAILSEYGNYFPFIDYIKNCSVKEKQKFCLDIFNLVEYLHSRNIFVTDFRPDNFLVNNDSIILSNIGIANIILKIEDEKKYNDLVNDLNFTAPEILEKERESGVVPDIYSFSKLIDFIFTNTNIYDSKLDKILSKASSIKPQDRYLNLKQFHTDIQNLFNGKINENIDINETFFNKNTKVEDINIVIDQEVKIGQNLSTSEPISNNPKETTHQNHLKNTQRDKNSSISSHKSYYEILADIEAEKKEEANRSKTTVQTKTNHKVHNSSKNTKRNIQTNTNNKSPKESNDHSSTSKTKNKNGYNRQQNTSLPPQDKINTAGPLVLGIIGFIFAFAVPFIGFILSIVGLSRAKKNNRKVKLQIRKFTSSERGSQTIGILFCIVSLIISITKMIIYVINLMF